MKTNGVDAGNTTELDDKTLRTQYFAQPERLYLLKICSSRTRDDQKINFFAYGGVALHFCAGAIKSQ
jgi:hypothetical protein